MERRRAHICREHAATEIALLQAGLAAEFDAERAAHAATPAITTHNILCTPALSLAVRRAFGAEPDARVILIKLFDLPAEPDDDIWPRLHVVEQESLDIHLVGAMDRLRHLIGICACDNFLQGLGCRRHVQPRQFMAAKTR